MRYLFVIILFVYADVAFSTGKYNEIHFSKLTEITGTEYVLASIENRKKIFEVDNEYLLFVNTETGQTKKVDFPEDSHLQNIEQIRIDSPEINKILVEGRTIDWNGKKGINWEDPLQIFILSTNGQEMNQLTDNGFFVITWEVNQITGTIVIAGYFDANNNKKKDKTDKNEIQIFDLKTLKLLFTL